MASWLEYARTDEQIENILPRVAHRIGNGGIKLNCSQFNNA